MDERAGADLAVVTTLIPGVTARVHHAAPDADLPLVLWIGDDDGRDLTGIDRLGGLAVVVSVEHRGADDRGSHLDDVDRALQWARSTGAGHGGDARRSTVVGIGSGAALAIDLADRVRGRRIAELSFVMVSPIPDHLAAAGEAPPIAAFDSIDDLLAALASSIATAPPTSTPPPAIDVDRRVEPPTRVFLDRLAHWDSTSIDTIRATYGSLPRPITPPTAAVSRRDDRIRRRGSSSSVPVRWYRPVTLSGPAPTLLYLHGGAFIMGTLDENDDRLDRLSVALDCAIVSVDYRLAPEHPYPAGLDDVEQVWRSLVDGSDPDVDPDRLVVLGSSAGAGLAAALCLRLVETGQPQPRLQCLVYPMLDDREHPSIAALAGGAGHWGLWHLRSERLAWDAYLAAVDDRSAPPITAVPGRAAPDELRGVAPAFIGVGDVDALVDSNLRYAGSLIAAGVPTELHVYPGVIHGGFVPRPVTDGTRAFLDDVTSALRRAIHGREDVDRA